MNMKKAPDINLEPLDEIQKIAPPPVTMQPCFGFNSSIKNAPSFDEAHPFVKADVSGELLAVNFF